MNKRYRWGLTLQELINLDKTNKLPPLTTKEREHRAEFARKMAFSYHFSLVNREYTNHFPSTLDRMRWIKTEDDIGYSGFRGERFTPIRHHNRMVRKRKRASK